MLPRRILVAGGAGFIGSHLCRRLLGDGHRVVCLDNFYTGSRGNIAHLVAHERFTLAEHDITNPLPLSLAVDEIYNLACPASPVHYQKDMVQTVKTAAIGTLSLLELAKGTGASLLQASTSEVYGDPQVHPQTEEYRGHVNPFGPRACYDEGKRVGETLCYAFYRQHGVRVKVARIFNTYGPRMQAEDGRVVSNFVIQALRGQPLTIYGTGDQTRSFCYVEDLVEGLVRLMATAPEVTGPVNLGNPAEMTMRALAEQILQLTGSRSAIEFLPLPADDPVRRRPDISLAQRLLGWEPAVPLHEGLERTIAYFRRLQG